MKLVLVRHGQSIYNLENKFTGWKDIDLTQQGIDEAIHAGKVLKKYKFKFDIAYTSDLTRAKETLNLILKELNSSLEPITNKALNERDYGDLVAQNKREAAKKFGKEQVQIWRRSFDIPPPNGESLKMTLQRTLPYFNSKIKPHLIDGKNIILSAHGNSIRSIIMELFNYTSDP